MASPDEIQDAAVLGKLDFDYPQTSKIVRIFTSSTFTDTKVERNALMSRIYPGLKTFCQEQGYEFQVVDMRWGVRDEATDDHMTSELCMKEIQECQRLSTGPNFVTFLAQKYGYRPFPPKIAVEEFEAILAQVAEENDKELLTSWFKKDENTEPALYLLQPIRSKLPHYADDSDPDKKKQDRSAWWAAFERMQAVLREASVKAFPENEDVTLKYKWAVTEEEIHNGILKAKDPKNECYWFKRTITDIGKFIKEKMTARFMDAIKGAPDKGALGLLDRLKNEYVSNTLPKDCVTQYSVKWTPNGIDPNVSEEHKTYIDKFCKDFDNTLRRMITSGIAKRVENEVKDALTVECMNHIQFAKSKLEAFSGRDEFLESIKTQMTTAKEDSKGLYLVLCGEPGAGKTSLMAKLSQEIPKWRDIPEAPVILRFLGTTSGSATTRDMLGSLCSQLSKISQDEANLPTDFKALGEKFKQYLEEHSEPLVIILDSLDQLRDKGGKLKEWLPAEVPENVTFILSAIPSENFIVVPEMKKFLPETYFMDVPQFNSNDISSVLDAWMKKAGRTLTAEQRKLVEETCQSCPLPLFAKLTVDEALRWKSYTSLDVIVLGKTVVESINFLFERVEKYHGVKLVSRALGFVTAAKSGLSLNEIEDVLSLDDFALNDVYQYHQPPLRRLPPLLWVRIQSDLRDYLIQSGADGITVVRWYHRQFQTVATERYLADEETKKDLHSIMVDYFMGKWSGDVKKDFIDKKGNAGEACRFVAPQPYAFKDISGKEKPEAKYNLRALNELPYHLTANGNIEELLDKTLLNFDFIYYKLKATSFDSLLDDYEFAVEFGLTHPDITTMIEFLRMSKDSLMIESEQLPTQITGRLTAMNSGSPGLTKLIDVASKSPFDCLISTQPHFRGEGESFTGKLVGSEGKVQCFNFNKDSSICISCADDSLLRLWQMSTGDEIKSIDLSSDEPHFVPSYCQDIGFCNDDQWAYIVSSLYINIWDLEKEQNVQLITLEAGPQDPTIPYLLPDTVTLVLACEANLEIWDLKTATKKESMELTVKGEEGYNNDRCALRGSGDTVIFHQVDSYGVDIFEIKTSGSTKKEYQIIKEKRERATAILVTTNQEGKMAYLYWEQPEDNSKTVVATFGVVDLTSLEVVFQKENIDYGYYIGYYVFCSFRDTDFIVTTHPAGKMVFNYWKSGSDDLQALDTLNTTYIEKFRETKAGQGVMLTIINPTLMEIMDFNNMVKASQEQAEVDFEEKNSNEVLHPVNGSKRYFYFTTEEYHLGIWDAAERQTVRVIEPPMYMPFSCNVTPTTIAFASQTTKTICTIDVIDGSSRDTGIKYSVIPGGQCRVTYLGNDTVLHNGPKPNQISASKISTGKEVWSMSIEKDGKISDLIVSEDGRVAIGHIPQTTEEMTADRMAEDKIFVAKLFCFDIKQRKRLPDLKTKNTTQLSTMMTLQHQALLTPDGKYYLSSTVCEDDVNVDTMVWDTATGKRRKLPQTSQGNLPGNLVYSKSMKCLVTTYQHPQAQIVLWDLPKLERIKTIEKDISDAYFLFPSPDGILYGFLAMQKKTLMTIVNIKTGKVIRKFSAETEVAHCRFTENNSVLLVSCRNKKTIVQLYMHDAEKQSKMVPKKAAQNCEMPSQEQLKLEELKKDKVIFLERKKMDLKNAPEGGEAKKNDQEKNEDKKEKSDVKKPTSAKKEKTASGKGAMANGEKKEKTANGKTSMANGKAGGKEKSTADKKDKKATGKTKAK